MSRKSLIVSLENDVSTAEDIEMIPTTQVEIDSSLNEMETMQEEIKDIQNDVLVLESYVGLLKQNDFNMSQESYSAVLVGVNHIYNKYGLSHTLTSLESHNSQPELVASMEGFIDTITDTITRSSDHVFASLYRLVKNTRKEKERLIKDLDALESRLSRAALKTGSIQKVSIGKLFSENGNQLTDKKDIKRVIENTIEALSLLKDYKSHRDFYEELALEEANISELGKHLALLSSKSEKGRVGELKMSQFFKALLTEKAEKDNVGEFFIKNRNGLGKASKTMLGGNTAYFVSESPNIFEFLPPFSIRDAFEFGVRVNKSEGDKELDLLDDPINLVKRYRKALSESFGYEDAIEKYKLRDFIREYSMPANKLFTISTLGSNMWVKFVLRWFNIINAAMRKPADDLNARIVRETDVLISYFEKHIAEEK